MCNLYFSIESSWKIKSMFINLKNFYILDIQDILNNFNLDLTKNTSVYFINNFILNKILLKAKIKNTQGIIYINKNLNEDIVLNIQKQFEKNNLSSIIEKYILIDDGQFPKLKFLYPKFEEILFFDRFQKNKLN